VSPEKGIDKGNCPRKKTKHCLPCLQKMVSTKEIVQGKKQNIACRASRKWYQQRKFSNECVQHPPAVDKREGTRKDMNHYALKTPKSCDEDW
jgi:hypothetical protein